MEKAILRQYARDLRRNSTDIEKHLWYYLRANRLGYKFKRQVPIEGFIVDFVCFQKCLIIELDGGQHLIDQEKDNHSPYALQIIPSLRGSEAAVAIQKIRLSD